MIKANVISGHSNWIKNIENPNDYINKRLKILSKAPFFKKKNHEFSVLLTNNKKMKKLNFKFRKKNKTTDVLSFPSNESLKTKKIGKKSFIYIGDIVINLSKLKINLNNKNFFSKFDETWVHGLTHLIGHKHKSKKDYLVMKKVENKFLKQIN